MTLSRRFKNQLKPIVPIWLLKYHKKIKRDKRIKSWKEKGSPIPPPDSYKQYVVSLFRKRTKSSVLIETGTYLGDMVEAQKYFFKKIYSIEIGEDLFNRARQRFNDDKNVFLINGDSGKELPGILKNLSQPVIFWLDGHYSGGFTSKGETECPILEELDAIFNSGIYNHTLLIDDARCFNGLGDYPTVERLTELIKNYNKEYSITVENDIIRCFIK